MLRILEGSALSMIYGPINDNGVWKTRYSNEFYKHCDEIDLVRVVKIGILKWLGHISKMQELDPCRKLTQTRWHSTCRRKT